jgi:hypothetical protein
MNVLPVFPDMPLKASEQPVGGVCLAACQRGHGHEVSASGMVIQPDSHEDNAGNANEA